MGGEAQQDPHIAVRTGRDGEHAIVEVRDNGCGIDAATRERLFTPFFTTKGEGGTGIGLSVCRDIVRAHGGRIDVESKPGQGACFTVRVPMRPRAAQEGSQGPARLLWVDGDRRLLAVMLRALSDRHHVVPATTVGEALTVLATDRRFDLVLCEQSLHGVAHLVDELRALDKDLAERVVFVVSGEAPLDASAGATLRKPVALDDLEHLIETHRR
jgi:CheY-like chemotaxis protein